jgi:hypothetical protein
MLYVEGPVEKNMCKGIIDTHMRVPRMIGFVICLASTSCQARRDPNVLLLDDAVREI